MTHLSERECLLSREYWRLVSRLEPEAESRSLRPLVAESKLSLRLLEGGGEAGEEEDVSDLCPSHGDDRTSREPTHTLTEEILHKGGSPGGFQKHSHTVRTWRCPQSLCNNTFRQTIEGVGCSFT